MRKIISFVLIIVLLISSVLVIRQNNFVKNIIFPNESYIGNAVEDEDDLINENNMVSTKRHRLSLSGGEISKCAIPDVYGEYYLGGFTTKKLKPLTTYKISLAADEESISLLNSYLNLKPDGSDYLVYMDPSYVKYESVKNPFHIYSASDLFDESFYFTSGAQGDTFVFLPIRVNETDQAIAVDTLTEALDLFSEVVIEEVFYNGPSDELTEDPVYEGTVVNPVVSKAILRQEEVGTYIGFKLEGLESNTSYRYSFMLKEEHMFEGFAPIEPYLIPVFDFSTETDKYGILFSRDLASDGFEKNYYYLDFSLAEGVFSVNSDGEIVSLYVFFVESSDVTYVDEIAALLFSHIDIVIEEV